MKSDTFSRLELLLKLIAIFVLNTYKALFPRRLAWQSSSRKRFMLFYCCRRNSDQSCRSTTLGLANFSVAVQVCHPSMRKLLMSDHLPTTNGKLRVTPQSLEQQRFFLYPRRVIKRNANRIRQKTGRRNAA
ncbi:hypothetical protein AVEN_249990-1 [Araneus ventricosus]|uniref:Uncharacterized protein n=1 Tax=Araneus ventricosus TaxID=182803 RepID=A0A4Y2LLV8_ARAVE|nr:hypothetical protein AVEN_249990-1 [Araneus ventricosus]